ncbi:MAG: enoyl-CoA hydratase/isomerase family protein [Ignavibacteria bacterium]|nr:enoyl-CoA hydratase/isomerase family protein [Ignavibacteria bacterium]
MEKVNVEYLLDNTVARVVLNAPKGNVMDLAMMHDLQSLLNQFETMNSLKLITFEGEGNHFSFGASVEEHRKEQAGEMLRNFHNLFYSLIELSIPTAAKVWGQCLGGAMELCLMCNFIFAERTAKFGQPEITLGVFPPPASLLLPMKIGSAKAEELLITGKTITADVAKAYGMVNEVFDDRVSLSAGTDEFINSFILPKSASSLRYAVKAARHVFDKVLKKELIELENLYVNNMMETEDSNEGIISFLEKRKPDWKNR